MAKYYGEIGFVETMDDGHGVWKETVVEVRNYTGDVSANTRRWQSANQVNDNLQINNKLSIVADPYAYNHFHSMRFAKWHGAYWEITNIEVQFPRLILTIGGEYAGSTERATG